MIAFWKFYDSAVATVGNSGEQLDDTSGKSNRPPSIRRCTSTRGRNLLKRHCKTAPTDRRDHHPPLFPMLYIFRIDLFAPMTSALF